MRRTRSSPIRIVSLIASKCSRSGIANLRLTLPASSLNWMALMLGYGFGRHPFALEWRREVLETLHLAESDLDPLLMELIDSLDMVETLATVPLAS